MTKQLTTNTSDAIAEHISSLELIIDVVQSDVPEELISLAITELNKTSVSFARAGFYLLNLKSRVSHGEFESTIKKHGVCRQRASEAMKVAKALMALPPATAKKLLNMPKARAVELSKIDPDYLDQIAESGELDEVAVMSRDELRDYVRSLETKNANLNQQLEIEHVKQKQLVSQRKNNLYPDFVEMARHESTSLADKAMLCVDDLARLRHELDAISSMPSHDAGFTRFLHIAQSALFHNLRAAAGRFNALLNELQNEFDETVTGPVDPVNYFTDDDIRLAVAERNLLVSDHKHEAVMREDERSLKKSQKSRKAGKGK